MALGVCMFFLMRGVFAVVEPCAWVWESVYACTVCRSVRSLAILINPAVLHGITRFVLSCGKCNFWGKGYRWNLALASDSFWKINIIKALNLPSCECRGVCGCVLPWLRDPRHLVFTWSQIGQQRPCGGTRQDFFYPSIQLAVRPLSYVLKSLSVKF